MKLFRQINARRLRRWWLLVLEILFFFALGLWIFFPSAALQQRLQHELTAQLSSPVDVGEISLHFPATIGISDIATTTASGIAIQLTNLNLSPSWYQLITGNPALKFSGETLGGKVTAQLDTAHLLQLSATTLHWDSPIPQFSTLHIQTIIDNLDASGFIESTIQLQQLKLQLSQLKITGLKQVGSSVDHLNLGTVNLQLSQNKQRLNIDNLESRDGDFSITAQGHIFLQHNLLHSRIDLTVTLAPRPGLDKSITTLLPLFAKQQQDGRYTVRIGGTLSNCKVW